MAYSSTQRVFLLPLCPVVVNIAKSWNKLFHAILTL